MGRMVYLLRESSWPDECNHLGVFPSLELAQQTLRDWGYEDKENWWWHPRDRKSVNIEEVVYWEES